MKWLGMTGLLAGAMVFLASGALTAQTASIGEGARVYTQNCVRCHNVRSPAERSSRDWATIVLHMRARGNLTKTEASAVRVFLQATNRQGDAPSAQPPATSGEGTEVEAGLEDGGEATGKKRNGTAPSSSPAVLGPHSRLGLKEPLVRYLRILSGRHP
jgi:hypothetical protein